MARANAWRNIFIVLAALGADQISKLAVEKYTSVGSQRVLIPGALNLIHTTNPGVAFGLFAESNSPWLPPVLI
ncbi:MAG: signal peptidase II, partial [Candidatus Acidiferrales bacterium]